jgi:hypothetical protein
MQLFSALAYVFGGHFRDRSQQQVSPTSTRSRTTVVHELTTNADVAVLLVIEMKLGFFLNGTSNHQMRADALAQTSGRCMISPSAAFKPFNTSI